MVPIGGLGDSLVNSRDTDFKPVINTMSVVAALIATVTFTAALAMPGGYDSSGDANLVKKPALWAFILSDALAMCSSIAVVALLWRAMRVEQDLQVVLNNACALLLRMAILGTLVAFMSENHVEFSKEPPSHTWPTHPNDHEKHYFGADWAALDADFKPFLVATLTATVTFAAAFTMPGGFDTSSRQFGCCNSCKEGRT
ncbi:hypothetical protein Vadar_007987 [Vaccinium darrowii]|uniref:Uncharacterized protein n=1 Tax=Vaccinium darrowii TaxID=229202 RepID=A0ACB7XP38_9ERIC|nr:hypothetical protein Vadar_007987 [Vaccinium darrowii]